MPETKKIVRSEPFVINKNMGSPMAISARDLTPKNADGLPVVLPTEKQKYDFDRNGWLLIPGVLSKDECDDMRTFAERLTQDPESIPEHERCPAWGTIAKTGRPSRCRRIHERICGISSPRQRRAIRIQAGNIPPVLPRCRNARKI